MVGRVDPAFCFVGEPAWVKAESPVLAADTTGALGLWPLPLAEARPGSQAFAPQAPAGAAAAGAGAAALGAASAGVALAPDGRLFWTDRTGHRIFARWTREGPCGYDQAIPCLTGPGGHPGQFRRPRGLAVSQDGLLYVADEGNNRVQVLALNRYQVVAVFPDLKGPWALALSEGKLFVAEARGGRVAVLDAHSGELRRVIGGGVLKRPTGIALGPEGLYVADPVLGSVVVFRLDDGAEVRRITPRSGTYRPAAVAVGSDRLWLGNRADGGILQLRADLSRQGRSPNWGGQALSLVADPDQNRLYAATGNGPPQSFRLDAGYPAGGELTVGVLDSGLHDCVWSKLQIRARVPPGTAVSVRSVTSQLQLTPGELALADWSPPVHHEGLREQWEQIELAVPGPAGRYLWLQFTLTAAGGAAPQIAWCRAYYPRSTYAQYLPAIFRSDPASADFLDRLMLLYEHFLGAWEHQAADMAAQFNPATTDFLDWLAGWLDFALDARWPDARRRELLAEAMELYRLRGTREGLQRMSAMHNDQRPAVIVEGFTRRGWTRLCPPGPGSRLGIDTVLPGGPEAQVVLCREPLGNGDVVGGCDPFLTTGAHRFTVYTYQYPDQPDDERDRLEQLIEAERPAHTVSQLCEVTPAMRLGPQSIIGLDTVVAGEYPKAVVGERSPALSVPAGRK